MLVEHEGAQSTEVVVVGAGIGGLTFAAALLRKRGKSRITVLERAPELGPAGAGITVQPNAILALRGIGLDRLVEAEGAVVRTSVVLDARGDVLAAMALEPIERAIGAKTVCIHRARLHKILSEAARGADLRLGCEVERLDERSERRPAAVTRAGERFEGDLLVGADGLHSRVRAALEGDRAPTYAGYTSWRGICPNQGRVPVDRATESWGRGERFGVVPIGHDQVYWFCTAEAPPGERDAPGTLREALLRRFRRWHAPIPDLLEATPEPHILRTDISDRPVIERWSRGRVVLLGDAAHPMTPNLGQGGCQAIEDAVVLARAIAGEVSIEAAIIRYERARVRRANEVVEGARKVGRIAQWSSPLACFVRDALTRATPTDLIRKRLERAFRFDPEAV